MRLMSKAFFSCGERISPADFLKRIQNDPRSVILDVRSTEEFAEGAVRGAVHIPDYKIEEEIHKEDPRPNHTDLRLLLQRRACRIGGATNEGAWLRQCV